MKFKLPPSFKMYPLPLKKVETFEEIKFFINSEDEDFVEELHDQVLDGLPDSLEIYWPGGPSIEHEKVLDKELGFMSSHTIHDDKDRIIKYEVFILIEFTVLVRV